MIVLPFRRIPTGLRNRPRKWTLANVKSCPWERINPCASTSWELTVWKAALSKGPGIIVASELNTSYKWAFAAKGNSPSSLALKGVLASWERWFFLSAQSWWGTFEVLCPILGSPVLDRHGHAGASPAKDNKDDKKIAASVICGEAERTVTAQPGEEKNQGGTKSMCINAWWSEVKKKKIRLFSEVSSDRTRGKSHKLV